MARVRFGTTGTADWLRSYPSILIFASIDYQILEKKRPIHLSSFVVSFWILLSKLHTSRKKLQVLTETTQPQNESSILERAFHAWTKQVTSKFICKFLCAHVNVTIRTTKI